MTDLHLAFLMGSMIAVAAEFKMQQILKNSTTYRSQKVTSINIDRLTDKFYRPKHTVIRSIASKLAFGMISESFIGWTCTSIRATKDTRSSNEMKRWQYEVILHNQTPVIWTLTTSWPTRSNSRELFAPIGKAVKSGVPRMWYILYSWSISLSIEKKKKGIF